MNEFINCIYIEEVDSKPRLDILLASKLFLKQHAHLGKAGSLALQRSPYDTDVWRGACGHFRDTGKEAADYTIMNPGTDWILPLLRAIEEHSGGKACRTRIMTMEPGRCLTYHKDPEKWRYHVPLVSNTSTRFLVENQVGNMPVIGALYRLRTDKMHTALNPSQDEPRTHIVVCVAY